MGRNPARPEASRDVLWGYMDAYREAQSKKLRGAVVTEAAKIVAVLENTTFTDKFNKTIVNWFSRNKHQSARSTADGDTDDTPPPTKIDGLKFKFKPISITVQSITLEQAFYAVAWSTHISPAVEQRRLEYIAEREERIRNGRVEQDRVRSFALAQDPPEYYIALPPFDLPVETPNTIHLKCSKNVIGQLLKQARKENGPLWAETLKVFVEANGGATDAERHASYEAALFKELPNMMQAFVRNIEDFNVTSLFSWSMPNPDDGEVRHSYTVTTPAEGCRSGTEEPHMPDLVFKCFKKAWEGFAEQRVPEMCAVPRKGRKRASTMPSSALPKKRKTDEDVPDARSHNEQSEVTSAEDDMPPSDHEVGMIAAISSKLHNQGISFNGGLAGQGTLRWEQDTFNMNMFSFGLGVDDTSMHNIPPSGAPLLGNTTMLDVPPSVTSTLYIPPSGTPVFGTPPSATPTLYIPPSGNPVFDTPPRDTASSLDITLSGMSLLDTPRSGMPLLRIPPSSMSLLDTPRCGSTSLAAPQDDDYASMADFPGDDDVPTLDISGGPHSYIPSPPIGSMNLPSVSSVSSSGAANSPSISVLSSDMSHAHDPLNASSSTSSEAAALTSFLNHAPPTTSTTAPRQSPTDFNPTLTTDAPTVSRTARFTRSSVPATVLAFVDADFKEHLQWLRKRASDWGQTVWLQLIDKYFALEPKLSTEGIWPDIDGKPSIWPIWTNRRRSTTARLPNDSLNELPSQFLTYWLALQPSRNGSLSNPLLPSDVPACFRIGGKNGIFCLVAMLCLWRNACIDKKSRQELAAWEVVVLDAIKVFSVVHDSI